MNKAEFKFAVAQISLSSGRGEWFNEQLLNLYQKVVRLSTDDLRACIVDLEEVFAAPGKTLLQDPESLTSGEKFRGVLLLMLKGVLADRRG